MCAYIHTYMASTFYLHIVAQKKFKKASEITQSHW